jgi:predicted dehydrogenase
MENLINIAVVGVGYLGRFHAQKYKAIEGVNLIGVVDVNENRAENVAEELNCDYYTDFSEIIDKADAVSLVVPTSNHYEIARELISTGIHCLIEKPITTTVEQAEELIQLANKNNVLIQVGHIERFNPAIEYLYKNINFPLFIEAHRISGFKERGIDVDVILDLMIHDIDITLSLVNSPILEIRASGAPVVTDNIDIANARIMFENGCTANLTASRISLDPIRRFRVFQPSLYVSADCAKRENLVVRTMETEDPSALYNLPFSSITPEVIKHDGKDQLETEIRSFIRSIKGQEKVMVDGEAGKEALRIAFEISSQISENIKKAYFFNSNKKG